MPTIWKPQKPHYFRFKRAAKDEEKAVSSFIYQIGDSDSLRQESREVLLKDLVTVEYKKKLDYLKKCLLKYRKLTGKGRAIASVQVGIPEKIIAVYRPEQKPQIWILINPNITARSKTILSYPEMCMSGGGLIARINRPAWVEVAYYNESGQKQEWKTKDDTKAGRMYNRVLQHEIDHLHGIINIDLVPSRELVFISDPAFYEKAKFESVQA